MNQAPRLPGPSPVHDRKEMRGWAGPGRAGRGALESFSEIATMGRRLEPDGFGNIWLGEPITGPAIFRFSEKAGRARAGKWFLSAPWGVPTGPDGRILEFDTPQQAFAYYEANRRGPGLFRR